MGRNKTTATDAELAVLRLLWKQELLTAREITDSLYPDGSETEFASVHSFLQRLEKKGFVDRDRSQFVHRFSAKVSQADFAGHELDALAKKLSDGSFAPFLLHLVQKERLSKEEADEIRRMLNDYAPKTAATKNKRKKR